MTQKEYIELIDNHKNKYKIEEDDVFEMLNENLKY